MKRLLVVLALIVAVAGAVGGIAWWRTRQATEATLRQLALVRKDTVILALRDSLEQSAVREQNLRAAESRAKAAAVRAAERAEVASATYFEKERELLASVEAAREALALQPEPRPPDSSTVTVNAAQLAGTLAACRVAVAAANVSADSAGTVARSCQQRADEAEHRAGVAERLAARADSGRLAAIDTVRRVLRARSRASFKQAAKTTVITIGTWEVVRLVLGLFGGGK